MKSISILCSDPCHPVNPWLIRWAQKHASDTKVSVLRDAADLVGGDFLFLVSCHQIIGKSVRDRFKYTLVLHASDLPKGRGMSPHVWQILEGTDRLVVSLLDAEDALDSGEIWHQTVVNLDGTELHAEIHAKLFDAEASLMDWALEHCADSRPRSQQGNPTFYRRRTPADSAIDPSRSLIDVFDLLRIADPERYPVYFEHRGQRYLLRIEKA